MQQYKRFLLSVVLIALLAAVAEYILPWWSAAVAAFVVSLFIVHRPGRAFLTGFAGLGLCWLVIALMRDTANDHILSAKMAMVFKLPGHGMFMVVTVIIGGLIGGMAAWAGALMKKPARR